MNRENQEELGNAELVERCFRLCHIRGEKHALNIKIEIELDEEVATLKEEIKRRLTLNYKPESITLTSSKDY